MALKNQPKVGMKLHKQIALGKSPKSVQTTKGLNSTTVPGYKKKA